MRIERPSKKQKKQIELRRKDNQSIRKKTNKKKKIKSYADIQVERSKTNIIKRKKMLRVTKVKEAAYLAISLHGTQTYDKHPYYYHLEQVVDVLKEFGFTEDKFIISGYLHDVMEDTAISYNDIKDQFGEEIAEIVYAVTDELGRNRKERKAKTYPKIMANPDAIIVKLADRIANLRNSIKNKPSMAKMYTKEFESFSQALYSSAHTEAKGMWSELGDILIINEVI